ERQDLDAAGVGEPLVVQRIARTTDTDLARIAEDAVLQYRRAIERQRTLVGDGAAIDGRCAKCQGSRRIDLDRAEIGDCAADIEPAADDVDRRAGRSIRNRALVAEVAAAGERDGAGVLQRTL